MYADRFYGDDQNNYFSLFTGDRADGFGGDDTIGVFTFEKIRVSGGIGNDTLLFFEYEDRLGADGAITRIQRAAGVDVNLSQGLVLDDGLSFSGSIGDFENVVGSGLADRIKGSREVNILNGSFGDDRLFGGRGDDSLAGSQGDDDLKGGAGDDIIVSDGGYDRMSGGVGVDLFRIAPLYPDLPTVRDTFDHGLIVDYASGEKIDISAIQAVDINPFESFEFIGTMEFTSHAQVRYEIVDGRTVIEMNTFGDRDADQIVSLNGEYALSASDFVL